MTRNYRVETLDASESISYFDFFLPKRVVTLTRLEDGELLKVTLPSTGNWKRGDIVALEDFRLTTAQSPAGGNVLPS